ncbi:relaxase/mobilization nuclease domain-containing protein [Pseudoramibacter sp. HA2172]|uniref:relaxase/mobilization nuclease domain-containing protein n=1 Tax=Pseudoramibacter faecis TaxID=3108534 RepID=UPI002E76C8CA|nr:relaxase/mobilization nuclease domain-containing protein [Pseudoramibacter sp. HA2172]
MATISLWRVNGWLGKVVIYVENPDKTENPAFYEKPDMEDAQIQGLSDVIAYAANQEKTQMEDGTLLQNFVSGVNCLPATAREEMLAVKKRFGKESGTAAYHGYQSFAPGEATPEIAHEIAVRLARQLWGNKYQVLVATHLDKENHLHSHFVINTVSFVDGIKFHRTEKDYYDMRRASDELCREYGLSVIENPKPGKSKHYGEWRAEQEQRPTWRGLVRSDVDEVIRQSMTERQFYDALKKKGYEIKTGRDISVRPPGKERFVRLARNFGEKYSPEGIRDQILRQDRPARRDTEKASSPLRPKATGFRALYYHYCYLLGIFPEKKPKGQNRRLHFLLWEDLLKMDAISEEARLLARHQIDTAGQLSSYKETLEARIEAVTGERKDLYKKQHTAAVKSDEETPTEVRERIDALTEELKGLRKEVRLCDDIAVRSGVMSGKLQAIEEEEKSRGKETKRDERIRRRG